MDSYDNNIRWAADDSDPIGDIEGVSITIRGDWTSFIFNDDRAYTDGGFEVSLDDLVNDDFDTFCNKVLKRVADQFEIDKDELLYGQSVKLIADGKEHRIPLVNVGTIGHCNYGKSVIQETLELLEVINKMDKRKILVIYACMVMANYRFASGVADAIPITAIDRRFIAEYDTKPELQPEQSWQTMNRGKLSKKQRRKL